jgi:hypothetical protein
MCWQHYVARRQVHHRKMWWVCLVSYPLLLVPLSRSTPQKDVMSLPGILPFTLSPIVQEGHDFGLPPPTPNTPIEGGVFSFNFNDVSHARRCCRRSRVRAPVWPGTFLCKNINIPETQPMKSPSWRKLAFWCQPHRSWACRSAPHYPPLSLFVFYSHFDKFWVMYIWWFIFTQP